VNLWMKRAIGAAALGGSLLALGAGAASAQEVAADASARLGRPTSAEVRVCADGRVLSRLLGSCSGQSATSATVRAGDGTRARVRVPRTASAAASVVTRRSRPAASASGQASAATRPRAATADADAAASLSRPGAGRLLDLRPLASLAGVGLLGSSPFTLVGDPASASLLPVGGLTLDDPAAETPAGIGVLDSGPIASGNQVDANLGDVPPSVPVMVCGNGVGVLGDASASCGANQASTAGNPAPAGSGSSNPANPSSDSLLDNLASGNQVDAGIGDVPPSVPVMVCGNGVGVPGDASASCGAGRQTSSDGTAQPSDSGGPSSGDPSGNQGQVSVESVSPSVPVTVCGNGVGLLGDANFGCGADTSTGGIIAPPPGTTPGSTDTDGTTGGPGSTGTSGIPGTTTGLTPGTSGGPGDPATTFALLRPSVSGVLPFTGAVGDLLALVAGGLLAAGGLIVRAARPATAATEGGEDRQLSAEAAGQQALMVTGR
jgi:hypothetical protein